MDFKVINFLVVFLLLAGLVLVFLGLTEFLYVFIFGLFYVIFILTLSTNVRFNYFVKSLSSVKTSEKKIAITFDDGPSENTLEILKILEKYQVQAAFFCIGKQIETHPEIFRKIIASGHLVGNHTYSHTRKMGTLNTKTTTREITRCNEVAEKLAGIKMNLFRPPFGIVSPHTRDALKATGMLSVGWSIRSFDAVIPSEEAVLHRVRKKIKPGGIILFHDTISRSNNTLEQLLLFLQEKDYQITRLDKLLKINAYT